MFGHYHINLIIIEKIELFFFLNYLKKRLGRDLAVLHTQLLTIIHGCSMGNTLCRSLTYVLLKGALEAGITLEQLTTHAEHLTSLQ